MKVIIDIPEEEYLDFVKGYVSDTIDDNYFEGEKYEKLIDLIISKVDYVEGDFNAKKQILADVMSTLLLRFGLTKERADLLDSNGFFMCHELANILQSGGHTLWIMDKESVSLLKALDCYIEENYEPIETTIEKVSKALDEEYFKELMEE